MTRRRRVGPRHPAARPRRIERALNPRLFKAMGSPTRLSLITCLAKSGRARSVSEVAERCSVAISQTSRTLALLARLGVVESTRRGREVLYCVRYDEVCSALRAAADAIERCCPDTGADSGERGGSRAGR